jgi:hypothetical protein
MIKQVVRLNLLHGHSHGFNFESHCRGPVVYEFFVFAFDEDTNRLGQRANTWGRNFRYDRAGMPITADDIYS